MYYFSITIFKSYYAVSTLPIYFTLLCIYLLDSSSSDVNKKNYAQAESCIKFKKLDNQPSPVTSMLTLKLCEIHIIVYKQQIPKVLSDLRNILFF